MALFHLHVTQVKRSAGQSAVACAAYRAGEKLFSEYYGEVNDFTRKSGVICSGILLPPQAPAEYQDRATLWNAVEKAERGRKAQLAYSFDIALQNEFSLEENIALARQFVSEQLVSRGMIAHFAIHQPDKEDGGIPNPHFHVLCPIRPIEETGKWGYKQRRVYRLDEDGNRIMGEDGKTLFDAVPTIDWGSPETLEHWREAWAAMVNDKFEEKGLTCRIDHRSYERQGLELLPTVHEGVAVRQMEAKGITTDKGDLNRWIKLTNSMVLGNLSRERYQKMVEGYEAEQSSLNNEIIGLEDWVETREEMDDSLDQFVALVEKYVDIPELTPTIVNEFIKKIIVYAPEKQGTKRIQRVRIIFNFLDELDMPEIGEPIVTETTYGRRKTA